jgi:hypothetical protein
MILSAPKGMDRGARSTAHTKRCPRTQANRFGIEFVGSLLRPSRPILVFLDVLSMLFQTFFGLNRGKILIGCYAYPGRMQCDS